MATKVPQFRSLKRHLVFLLMVASAIPLTLVGGIIYFQYRQCLRYKVDAEIIALTSRHKTAIDHFLTDALQALRMAVNPGSGSRIVRDQAGLQKIFDRLRSEQQHTYEDLGVIDAQGHHLAYIGPYDLRQKNYRQAEWFRYVMKREVFISNVFLGFRRIPHFVVAVRYGSGETAWVLRATINSAYFQRLVEDISLGKTGEAFILNPEGLLQTRLRRGGQAMAPIAPDWIAPPPGDAFRLRRSRADPEGKDLLQVEAWLKEGQWLLVVRQDADAAFVELTAARNLAVLIFGLAVAFITVVSLLATRIMVNRIQTAAQETRRLDVQDIQRRKLADVGQIASRIAKAVDKPMAVIGGEAGWIQNLARKQEIRGRPNRDEFHDSLKEITRQAGRCRQITYRLLCLARQKESAIREVDVNRVLEDATGRIKNEARVHKSEIRGEYGADCSLAGNRTVP